MESTLLGWSSFQIVPCGDFLEGVTVGIAHLTEFDLKFKAKVPGTAPQN